MKVPSALITAAEKAIRDCRTQQNPVWGTGEVAEVARLVLQLPEKLVLEWRPYLQSGELDVLGVFAHKTPKARCTDWHGKSRLPELCDLLLVLDCEEPSGRTRRALVIQAKVADPGSATGQFKVDKNGPDVQRYLYAHLPKFKLTGLRPTPKQFNIAPTAPGKCLGVRYACIDVNAPVPASGWWLEDAQPSIPVGLTASGAAAGYDGVFRATVPLGKALSDMVVGTLGEPLKSGGDWERLVDHLVKVGKRRYQAGKKPPDVVAAAAGTLLPHVAAASLFMTNATAFFETKAMSGHDVQWGRAEPPNDDRPRVILETQGPGFGIVYIRLVSPEWRDEAAT
ncbi:hypothetical protein [Burkholderia sp. BCC0405]|uniref:hypothetical protein n=1 Tax=Burkholderia sp. BCC0405 TaxID=2676298 RepID=UPI00158F390C|nr:hypothetical protein [Burkholderia sp. BCC0405]